MCQGLGSGDILMEMGGWGRYGIWNSQKVDQEGDKIWTVKKKIKKTETKTSSDL